VSAIIKKEESPLVVPLLFEETGDAKKEDRQSPSLSSYRTRSPIEPPRGYTPRPPSIYNPSTPVRSPSPLPEPIDWEQILIIPRRSPSPRPLTSDNGSSTVVESIGGILHRAFLPSEVSDIVREGVQLGILQREQERRRQEILARVLEARERVEARLRARERPPPPHPYPRINRRWTRGPPPPPILRDHISCLRPHAALRLPARYR
jgi:hypothetical protein